MTFLRPLGSLPVRVFLAFLLIYTATWGGHYTSGDGAIKIAWAKALLERGSSQLDPTFTATYAPYGVGHTLIAIPGLAVSRWLGNLTGLRTEAALYTYLFIANGALFMATVARYLSRSYSRGQVLGTVTLMGLATTWWPYTKLDFSEPFVCTLFFLGFVLMGEGRPKLGLAVASLAGLFRFDAFLFLPLLLLWWGWQDRNWRQLIGPALAGVPAVGIHLASNYVRGGHLFYVGYTDEHFSTPLIVGLYGMLFSAGKSVFLFSPPLLLGVLGWRRFAAKHNTDAWLFAAIFSVNVLLFASWWDWSGDDSWGVRFVIPGVMLMTIPMIELLERRLLVATVASVGICIQLLGVVVSGLDYILLVRRQPALRHNLFTDQQNRLDLEDVRFNPRYGQIAGHAQLVRTLLGIGGGAATRDVADVRRSGTPSGDVVEASVWESQARWDFIWMRLRERRNSE